MARRTDGRRDDEPRDPSLVESADGCPSDLGGDGAVSVAADRDWLLVAVYVVAVEAAARATTHAKRSPLARSWPLPSINSRVRSFDSAPLNPPPATSYPDRAAVSSLVRESG